MTLAAEGLLEETTDGFCLRYQGEEKDGLAGTETTLRVMADAVDVQYTGAVNALLRLEEGRRHRCDYDTGCGVLSIVTHAHSIRSACDEGEAELALHYILDFGAGMTAEHRLHAHAKAYE